jgi:hypothetical protein
MFNASNQLSTTLLLKGVDNPLTIDSTTKNIKLNYDSNSFEVSSNNLKIRLATNNQNAGNSGLEIYNYPGREGLKISLESGTPLYILDGYNLLTFFADRNQFNYFTNNEGVTMLRLNIDTTDFNFTVAGLTISTSYKNELTTLKNQCQTAKTG